MSAITSDPPGKTLAGLRQKIEGKSAKPCLLDNRHCPDNSALISAE
jgi:hypothetical protein